METRQLSPEDLSANQELDRQFVEAMSRKDVDGAMACFWKSPDLIFVSFDGSVHVGWDKMRQVIENVLSDAKTVHLEINEVTHLHLGEAVAAVGTATYRIQPKEGPLQEIRERWTDVRRKIDGRWVYALDHAHALPPGTM